MTPPLLVALALALALAGGPARADAPMPLPLIASPGGIAPIPVAPPSDAWGPQPIKTTTKVKQRAPFAGDRGPVQQVQAFNPTAADVSAGEYQYLVEPPGPDKLFTLDSEGSFMQRLEQEWRDNGHKDRLIFPEEENLSTQTYLGRSWPPYSEIVEPYFVAHNRLEFEQINYERYGWDLGIIDPPLSAARFFADVVMLPYHAETDPCRHFDTGAGYCLPGDPVPLLIYPPELSLTGTLAEAAAVVTVFATFP